MALDALAEFITTRGHSQGANRHEAIQCPPRLEDDLAADNPGRCMEACVEALALATLGVRQVVAAATGRPRAQPGDLLTRDIDGSLDRWRSSRRLEQETPRHGERMGRLKQRRPDHKTIAHVRRDHRTPLRDVCRTLTGLCKQRDRCGGELVAIDGSQFSAVNAQGGHVTQATRAQGMAQIEARVEGSLKEVAAADDQDEAGPPGGARAADRQTKIAARRERRRRDKDLQAEWACSGQDQRSLTAPDRRAMPGGTGSGPAVCDHVQPAVEAKHQRIGACEVTHEPTDRDWRSPMAIEATASRGGPCDVVADMGSSHGQEVQQGLPMARTPEIAPPSTAANPKLGLCSQDECTDAAATETYGGPAGEGLSGRFDTIELGRHLRDDATSAGRPCPLKA
jgi:transposase